jgi:hypothetical protein
MAKKSARLSYFGDNYTAPIGNVLVDEELYDLLVERDASISVTLNHVPDTFYSAKFRDWEDKKWQSGDGGGKKKGKW